jgi:hypothetical protein
MRFDQVTKSRCSRPRRRDERESSDGSQSNQRAKAHPQPTVSARTSRIERLDPIQKPSCATRRGRVTAIPSTAIPSVTSWALHVTVFLLVTVSPAITPRKSASEAESMKIPADLVPARSDHLLRCGISVCRPSSAPTLLPKDIFTSVPAAPTQPIFTAVPFLQ